MATEASWSSDEWRTKLLHCCGSHRWVELMLAQRPPGADAQLERADWLEAFAAHPEIGTKTQTISTWEAQEQSGAAQAAASTLDELSACNQAYKAKFGYIYIVCATGKSAGEMLAIVQTRLRHAPASELVVAAQEQAKITQIRLTKLVAET
ncbi:OHCU decarboxylase [Saprolegnia parasitica CBS 223.65]|uniref:2-oxo-4-hydroxy-4-carboxy-5-ureidoimidazoline decarboxylase n=1 Tax=Saprolegnia parasitica (strain CBS 223.65) TaxID=695850 RepID=A0A067CCI6_SAPPC|nr:OHCU decarboxylase [Saprolegnia parasitica CBS 223.65]KDO28489.1 OHCU decarboxylase [Saprolegnia parasitica CBS 223.65]|eukprot:XP_012200927.1 OHCU decarboxylase [Saprolegnia parasitica CBS 223.65]